MSGKWSDLQHSRTVTSAATAFVESVREGKEKSNMKWKYLLPMFLMIGRQFAESLRQKDADSSGKDDEAAEAIDFALTRVQAFLDSKESKK